MGAISSHETDSGGQYELHFQGGELVYRPKVPNDSRSKRSIWRDVGVFGEIGYSIIVPIVLGLVIGSTADRKWESYPRFTLGGIIVGMALSMVTFVATILRFLRSSR